MSPATVSRVAFFSSTSGEGRPGTHETLSTPTTKNRLGFKLMILKAIKSYNHDLLLGFQQERLDVTWSVGRGNILPEGDNR